MESSRGAPCGDLQVLLMDAVPSVLDALGMHQEVGLVVGQGVELLRLLAMAEDNKVQFQADALSFEPFQRTTLMSSVVAHKALIAIVGAR
jgi:hypothetical protein